MILTLRAVEHFSCTKSNKGIFTIPAGAILYRADDMITQSEAAGTTEWNYGGGGVTYRIQMKVLIYIGGGNAGTVQFQWAQSTAEAGWHKTLAGSNIILIKLN
jgi:hypothetical protein